MSFFIVLSNQLSMCLRLNEILTNLLSEMLSVSFYSVAGNVKIC